MSEAPDLKAVSDDFIDLLGRLHDLEVRKRQVMPASPEFVALAREVEGLSGQLLADSASQHKLAVEVSQAIREGEVALDERPIEAQDPPRHLAEILYDWRDAERRYAVASPGTPDAAAISNEIARLREEYRRASETAARRQP
ncbi:MAG: hypothetical protein ACJ761_09205 [Chloroflexota bacterium]